MAKRSGSTKTKNCTKGYSCGAACIARPKNCQRALDGEPKSYADWLQKNIGRDDLSDLHKQEAASRGIRAASYQPRPPVATPPSQYNEKQKAFIAKADEVKRQFDDLLSEYNKTPSGSAALKELVKKMEDLRREEAVLRASVDAFDADLLRKDVDSFSAFIASDVEREISKSITRLREDFVAKAAAATGESYFSDPRLSSLFPEYEGLRAGLLAEKSRIWNERSELISRIERNSLGYDPAISDADQLPPAQRRSDLPGLSPELRSRLRLAERTGDPSEENLQALVDSKEVTIAVTEKAISSILSSGEFRNAFYNNVGGAKKFSNNANHYLQVRRAHEESLMGISSIAPKEERPVYGAMHHPREISRQLSTNSGSVGMYGDYMLVMKPSVRERATVTVGDSLSDLGLYSSVPDQASPINAISSRSTRVTFTNQSPGDLVRPSIGNGRTLREAYDNVPEESRALSRPRYLEVQIHDRARREEIATIYEFASRPLPNAARNNAAKNGIEVVTMPGDYAADIIYPSFESAVGGRR